MARLKGSGGGVYVGEVVIHDCDVVFDELIDGDVTESLDTSDYVVGSGSNKFVLAAGLGAGDIIATDAISSLDLSAYTTLMAWLKCDAGASAADLALLLDDTANCASPVVESDVVALGAGEWVLSIADEDLSGCTAIISVGLKHVVDIGATTVRLDKIMAAKKIAGVKEWSLNYKMNTQEVTGFDSSGHKEHLPTIDEWNGSFNGYKDGGPLLLRGQVVNLDLRESQTAGQKAFGAAIITDIGMTTPVDGVVMYTYTFLGTGKLTIPTA